MNKLQVHDLSIRYRDASSNVLQDISFTLDYGKLLLIQGPNGSGKSTLLRALVKLFPIGSLARSTGKIIGFENTVLVLQRPKSQIITFRVDEEIASSLSFSKVPREMRVERVEEILDVFGFNQLSTSDPRYLSSGQQQVLVVLSAIIDNHDILLLDEPYSLLDDENKSYLTKLLVKLKESGTTILIVDHNTNLPEELVDESIFLDKGEISIPNTLVRPVFNFRKLASPKTIINKTLTIGYEKPLFNIKLNILEGITLVVGKNGSGKTALLRTLARMNKPVKGTLGGVPSYYYVPQDSFSFYSSSNVGLELGLLDPEPWSDYMNMSPLSLSEGERKKLALYIALGHSKYVIIDEPSQGLDLQNIIWFIQQLSQSEYQSIIIASNDIKFIHYILPYVSNTVEVGK